MRFTLWPPALLLLTSPALAGVRSPAGCFPNEAPCGPRSTFLVHGMHPSSPCQFRFRADGGLDQLTLTVTLRDGFDHPVPGCTTTVGLEAGPGTLALCGCCDLTMSAVSGPAGEMEFVFAALGGRGELQLALTTHCSGDIPWFSQEIAFTSTDLDASCEPGLSTNVIDLAIWAGCLPPGAYCATSDFNCNGTVNVIDLGMLAGGLPRGCDDAVCP
jgi:hypothetical protein